MCYDTIELIILLITPGLTRADRHTVRVVPTGSCSSIRMGEYALSQIDAHVHRHRTLAPFLHSFLSSLVSLFVNMPCSAPLIQQ